MYKERERGRENMKSYQKEFEVAGVKLKLKKLGIADFPTFKTIYARAVDAADAEGVAKAYMLLYSWLEQEVMGEWVPVFNKAKSEFTVDILNDLSNADEIVNILLSDTLSSLFPSTVV
jgi:hypothetical protein